MIYLKQFIIGITIFVITVALNYGFRPMKTTQSVKTTISQKATTTQKPKAYSEPMFTNNQKAALFLIFPLGGVVWLGIYSIISNRNKIKDAIVVRESQVIFN